MARAAYFSDFERDVIRVGVATGQTDAAIARFLRRTRRGVSHQRHTMISEGTIGNLPLSFVASELAGAIQAKGDE